jgi:hypothetical protein
MQTPQKNFFLAAFGRPLSNTPKSTCMTNDKIETGRYLPLSYIPMIQVISNKIEDQSLKLQEHQQTIATLESHLGQSFQIQQSTLIVLHNMEEKLNQQACVINEQQTIIDRLTKSTTNIRSVVYQLLGCLFDHDSEIIDLHIKHLFDRVDDDEEIPYVNSNSPSNRQGDQNKSRIYNLEKRIHTLESNL